MKHAAFRPPFGLGLGLAATAILAGCATTGSTGPTADRYANTRPASAEDCAVVGIALELFSRPLDGSPLKVSDLALVQTPPFRPQAAHQTAREPLSLRNCRALQAEFVATGATVTLNRPEVHDRTVLIRYREGSQPAVYAEMERTPSGSWRHIGAYVAPN